MPREMKITVKLELVGDSIRGSAVPDGGAPRAFSGWIGLVGAIEDISRLDHGAESPAVGSYAARGARRAPKP